jgi:NAD(P)-dependent dehydrogenase (short-subunit alcohol dehydrogenase family)
MTSGSDRRDRDWKDKDWEKDWKDKVVLVTGASRGVGRALAVALGGRGAAVACAARATDARRFRLQGTVDEAARAVDEAGGQGLAVPTDLSHPADIPQMISVTVARFGGIDVLVNNAAVTFAGDLDVDDKRFDLMVGINVRAPMVATRLVRPHLAERGGGRILNVSSFAAVAYHPTMMTYGMTKAALEHLTVSSAAQLEGEGIAVNCLRIDYPVASEGYMMNAPDADHSTWAAPAVSAEGMVWMLEQPPRYTGRIESMVALARRTGCMPSIADAAPRVEPSWPVALTPDR